MKPSDAPVPDPELSQSPWPDIGTWPEARDSCRNGPHGNLGDRGRCLRGTPIRRRECPGPEIPSRGGTGPVSGILQPGSLPRPPFRVHAPAPLPGGSCGCGPEDPDRGSLLSGPDAGGEPDRDGRPFQSPRYGPATDGDTDGSADRRDFKRASGYPFQRPEGGIYLWLETPGIAGKDAVSRPRAGFRLSPGEEFSVTGKRVEAVRLSISRHGAQALAGAVCAMASAWEGR
jgi:hypothetical protein